MIIRSTIDFGEAKTINICIARIEGYQHTEAFREACERIEEEARRQNKRCTVSKKATNEVDLNIVFGAHLNPSLAKEVEDQKILLMNLERLKILDKELNQDYLKLLGNHNFVDFSSANQNFCIKNKIKPPLYLYRPWHESRWKRVIKETTKIWDVCMIGTITPRREKVLRSLEKAGLKVKQGNNYYSFERDQVLAQSKYALNIHAYDNESSAELWRLNYLLTNGVPIISEKCIFEKGEEDISAKIIQYEYDTLAENTVNIIDDHKKNAECMHFDEYILDETRKELPKHYNINTEDKPTTLNIGCGNKWKNDAINIDTKENEANDLALDITSDWKQINQVFKTKRFGNIHLNENGFDAIEAVCVLEHLRDLEKGIKNILRLLKPGGWLYVKFPHQDSLGAWQDPTHLRGLNENFFKYLNEWSSYLDLGDTKMTIKWMNLIEETQQGKFNRADKERIGFVEAVLVKNIVKSPIKAKERTKKNIEQNQNLGLCSFRENILRKTLLMCPTSEDFNIDKNATNDIKKISLLTPTFGDRFKFLSLASKWINKQDYPKDLMEWVILTDTEDESEFLKQSLENVNDSALQIRIDHCTEKMPIGQKRNVINRIAEGDILINIDDDDYYFPNRVSEAVKALETSDGSIELAGTRHLPILFLDDMNIWISSPGGNRPCAGSFAFKKSLLNKTWYPNKAKNGEEIGFTDGYNLPFAVLDPFSTMICIAHTGNTFDKKQIRKHALEQRGSDIYLKEKGYEGTINFAKSIEQNNMNQALWASEYKTIEDKEPNNTDLKKEIFRTFNETGMAEKIIEKIVSKLGKKPIH